MAKDLKLTATARTEFGSTACRRMRREHQVPGNVYGHGEEPQAIAVALEAIQAMIQSGHKIVDYEIGSTVEKALLRSVQWDAFGSEILHFDLQRVAAGEEIETDVPVETHGTSPGVLEGGILEVALHSLTVRAAPSKLPDRFDININSLQIGDTVHVRDVELGEGVTLVNDPDDVVVHVVEPVVVTEETTEPVDGAGDEDVAEDTTAGGDSSEENKD